MFSDEALNMMILCVLTRSQVAPGAGFKSVGICSNGSTIIFSLSLCNMYFLQPKASPEDEEGRRLCKCM